MDDRTLHEVYGWPFLRAVQAGAASVMCSYNQLNGTYACENDRATNQVLRKQFGFRGFMMSDWWATMSTVPSVKGGLDMTMPGDITIQSGNSYFGQNLTSAINRGSVNASELSTMCERIMSGYYLLGLDDPSFPNVTINFPNQSQGGHVNVQQNHNATARKIAADSIVLLKNTNSILPLSSRPGLRVAVIGSDAAPTPGGPNVCEDRGCNRGTLAVGWGSGTANFPYLKAPIEDLNSRARFLNQTISSSLSDDVISATRAALDADVVLVFVNANSGEVYLTVEGNMGDRNDLNLWHNGNALIDAVANVNPNVVVVIHTVGPVLMPWLNSVRGVVYAGLPGQESGNSLVDVLYGQVNPGGKLVQTIAASANDYNAAVLYRSSAPHPVIEYSEGLFIDYRSFDYRNIQPLFEFGFGLSYTTFTYLNITSPSVSISSSVITPRLGDDGLVFVSLSCVIANSGGVMGSEVAQLYLAYPPSVNEPPSVLRGFEKVMLNIGEKKTITFNLYGADISVWDTATQSWLVPCGLFGFKIGASSRDIRLTTQFNVTTNCSSLNYPPLPPPPPSTSSSSAASATTGATFATVATATSSSTGGNVPSSASSIYHDSTVTYYVILVAAIIMMVVSSLL
eukprot:TRINITY_DN1548_c1_g1_i4.p1 TRINITY_DN1548_c1_g1~~TRINITY_DN1548_c1_g1_i4.p1  ORF type:complete len:648 (-),score=117.65 TRINITY_DN1548_c1_g1_i4:16-1890(-)